MKAAALDGEDPGGEAGEHQEPAEAEELRGGAAVDAGRGRHVRSACGPDAREHREARDGAAGVVRLEDWRYCPPPVMATKAPVSIPTRRVRPLGRVLVGALVGVAGAGAAFGQPVSSEN